MGSEGIASKRRKVAHAAGTDRRLAGGLDDPAKVVPPTCENCGRKDTVMTSALTHQSSGMHRSHSRRRRRTQRQLLPMRTTCSQIPMAVLPQHAPTRMMKMCGGHGSVCARDSQERR